jgi:hypothetical protein
MVNKWIGYRILSRVRRSVTINDRFWIWLLYLLAFLLQLHLITITYDSSQSMTAYDSFHSFLDYKRLLFHCDWLGSDVRIIHFFSFRCPLVNTPQLNTQLLNSLLRITWKTTYEWTGCRLPIRLLNELTNELSFITRGEPKRDHCNQQFVYWFVLSVAMGMCLPNRCGVNLC